MPELPRFPSLRDGITPYFPVLRPAGQRRFAPLFQSAPGRLVEPTFEAWEAPVLPLNYTRGMRLNNRDSHHCVTGLLRTVTPGIHASRDT